ncbi:MAG: hypothetical protein ABJK59_10090 [Erythrobacter sp.]|uniref:hypothetical protein n=1 Tax=Erythrobacter sp. TaxID=1042 RepID=UPI00329746D1
MSGIDGKDGTVIAQSDWLLHTRFIPAPLTAVEKAAIAASIKGAPASKTLNRARLAFGSAAVAVAVAVPNLSLEAMVGAISETSFGNALSSPELQPIVNDSQPAAAPKLATEIWTPEGQVAAQISGLLYADVIDADDGAVTFSSEIRLSAFDRELPMAVLNAGSQEFDLAFSGVGMPSALTALVPPSLPVGPSPVTQSRSDAIATGSLAIEQITDLDLVVRATPENAGPDTQSLALSSSSARTDAIANRSVEAAFAGAIDASTAVRSSLPIAANRGPAPRSEGVDEVRRAIPVGAPSPDVSATAAAQAVLVSKTKLDARVNGVLTGSVDFQQRDGTIAIRLRSVADMMREQFSKTEFAAISQGSAIDSFVTLAQLQAAGIPVSYNPAYDEIEFGIDYQDAPNAKKVQVDQISVPSLGSELTAIEQIGR